MHGHVRADGRRSAFGTILILLDYSLTVKAATLIFISGRGSAISSIRFNLYRGSYMSAHVLLNLLNESGKRDKMRGLPSILSLFRNEFNKFNHTKARILDSIYHMTNTLKSHFWRKSVIIVSFYTLRC